MARERGPEIARLNLRSGGDVSIGAFWEINSAFFFAGINKIRGVTSDEESLKRILYYLLSTCYIIVLASTVVDGNDTDRIISRGAGTT